MCVTIRHMIYSETLPKHTFKTDGKKRLNMASNSNSRSETVFNLNNSVKNLIVGFFPDTVLFIKISSQSPSKHVSV